MWIGGRSFGVLLHSLSMVSFFVGHEECSNHWRQAVVMGLSRGDKLHFLQKWSRNSGPSIFQL